MDNGAPPATYEPASRSGDRAAGYARILRSVLRDAPAPLAVKELVEAARLSDRLTRDGLEWLLTRGEVVVSRRYTPHKRGLPPLVYALRPVEAP